MSVSKESLGSNECLKVLFLCQTKSQYKQYDLLSRKADFLGEIVSIKRPSLFGAHYRAAAWLVSNRVDLSAWVDLQLDKAKVEGGNTGGFVKTLLKFRIFMALSKAMLAVEKFRPDFIFVRNGSSYRQAPIVKWAKSMGIKVAYIENGFLPKTVQLDGRGVNSHNSIPRDPDFYRLYESRNAEVPERKLVQRKSKVDEHAVHDFQLPEHYYFVPFQVPTDTQVLQNSPWITSMEVLFSVLEECVAVLPENYKFIVKEHPSSHIRFPHLHSKNKSIVFANAYSTQELIENATAVITLNSTVGIEAMLLGKPVITLANACYNIKGLVSHVTDIVQLTRVISSPDTIPYDAELIEKFIVWLKEEYLIPGQLRMLSEEENAPALVRQRLEDIYLGLYK